MFTPPLPVPAYNETLARRSAVLQIAVSPQRINQLLLAAVSETSDTAVHPVNSLMFLFSSARTITSVAPLAHALFPLFTGEEVRRSGFLTLGAAFAVW